MTESLPDRLLLYLRQQSRRTNALETIIVELGVGRQQILDAVNELTILGYALQLTETEIRLLSSPDLLTATEIQYGLTTERIGCDIRSYQTLKSTNQTALQLATQGAKAGTIVLSEEQTAGRGRLGRLWQSPPGLGIYLSIILRPQFATEHASGLPLLTGLIVANTIEEQTNVSSSIKWPNDLLIDKRKVCGILTELSADREKIQHLVVGIGININQALSDFPDELQTTATSLQIETTRFVNRVEFLQTLLINFETDYTMFTQSGLKPFLKQIKAKSTLLGQRIRIGYGNNLIEGVATDLSDNGSLVVATETGQVLVSGGEATILHE